MIALIFACLTAMAAPSARVVDHVATLQGDAIGWETTIQLSEVADVATQLPLAVPLPADVTLVGVTTVTEGGRITALVVPPMRGRLDLKLVQPAPGGQAQALAAPLFADGAVHRIDLDGLRWQPAAGLGLEQRMRRTITPGLTVRERHDADRMLDGKLRPKGSRIYVLADPALVAAGGLSGPVSPAGAVSFPVAVGVAGLFGLALGIGLLGYRLLEGYARRERLERYMSDEFVRLELDAARGPAVASAGTGGLPSCGGQPRSP